MSKFYNNKNFLLFIVLGIICIIGIGIGIFYLVKFIQHKITEAAGSLDKTSSDLQENVIAPMDEKIQEIQDIKFIPETPSLSNQIQNNITELTGTLPSTIPSTLPSTLPGVI